jgi:hypothetical protein
LNKLEFSGLAINHVLRTVRRFIIPQLSYILANSYLQKGQDEQIDIRKRVINNLVKGQRLQNAYIHAPLKNGNLEIPQIEKEMHAYRILHIAYLLQITEGKNLLKEYTRLGKNKVSQYLSLSLTEQEN